MASPHHLKQGTDFMWRPRTGFQSWNAHPLSILPFGFRATRNRQIHYGSWGGVGFINGFAGHSRGSAGALLEGDEVGQLLNSMKAEKRDRKNGAFSQTVSSSRGHALSLWRCQTLARVLALASGGRLLGASRDSYSLLINFCPAICSSYPWKQPKNDSSKSMVCPRHVFLQSEIEVSNIIESSSERSNPSSCCVTPVKFTIAPADAVLVETTTRFIARHFCKWVARQDVSCCSCMTIVSKRYVNLPLKDSRHVPAELDSSQIIESCERILNKKSP